LYDKAIGAYRTSLEIDPLASNIESYINLAALLQQTGAIEEAEKVMLRAVEQSPRQPSTKLYLAEIYSDLEDTTKAIDQIRDIRRIASNQLPVLNHAGQIAFELDHLELADSIFSDELARFPESVLGNYFRGRIAIHQDRPQNAKHFFWTLIEVADSLPDGYINLGVLYMDEDSTDLAIDILNEGTVRATNGREEVQYYLGTALSGAERYDEVVNIAKQLVSKHPGEIRFMFMLGAALERTEQHDSAAVIFRRILKIDSDHAQTLNYLGYMWADLGVNLRRSLELIAKALEIDGENPAYLDSYGWVLYKLERYEEAESYIRKAIDLMEDQDYILYDHLADIYSSVGRHEEAKANWRKALELDPGNDRIREKLAR
jgi:tetratricopeptide (TPR) repeat protein